MGRSSVNSEWIVKWVNQSDTICKKKLHSVAGFWHELILKDQIYIIILAPLSTWCWYTPGFIMVHTLLHIVKAMNESVRPREGRSSHVHWSEHRGESFSWDKVPHRQCEARNWQDLLTGEASHMHTSHLLPEERGIEKLGFYNKEARRYLGL